MPGASPDPRVLAGRFELLEEAGRGAMGVVYRARDRESGRTVALKALQGADPDDLYRLKSEFRALAGVVHPHLVRLYEMLIEGDRGFFTMEFIEGGRTVVEHLRNHAAPADALRDAFRQLATALAFLHASGWIHRDLKPSNVLVDPKGRLVLLDFGLIRGIGAEQSERTQVGAIVGTLAYMSPEQALGRPLSAASDWYSFGVLLYECLTGRSPFAGASPAVLADRIRFAIPPATLVAPGCPPDLADLASALLASDPVRRPDASRVLAALSTGPEHAPDAAAQRSTPFIGRASELARLRQAWASLRTGAATVVTLEGSSGLGKSALLERFVGELPAQGALVLRARCYPHEIVPFEALDEVVDDLSRYLSSLSSERLEALLPRDTAALCKVFPVLGRISLPPTHAPLSPDTEPHELRRRGFAALRELLARLADRRPLVVWVDDLQWADADSAPLMREMLRAPDAPPVLWLFSFRAEDRDQSLLLQGLDKLLESVPGERRYAIALGPLSGDESRELLGLLAQAPLEPDAAAAITVESRGSPFLLTELMQRRAEADRNLGAGHVALDEVIRRRLAGLPAEARLLLESISVAAGPLERNVALEAAGVGALDPDLWVLLESSRLLRSAASDGRPRLEIYHDQIREAIHGELTPEMRGARHLGIADALERMGSQDAAALSMHHGGAGNRAAAARYAFQAGEQAGQQLAFDQAARFYRSALEHDRAAVDVALTLARFAEALANAGHGPQAAAAFEAAAAETTALDAETLRQRAAEQYLVCGRLEEGKRVLMPLLSSHGVRYPATSSGALAGTLLRLPRLALHYFGRRGGAAEPSPTLALRLDACYRAARGLHMVDPPRAVYFSVLSLVYALRAGDPVRTGRALCMVGGPLASVGGLAAAWARSMLERAERLAVGARDPHLDGMVMISVAQLDFVAGRFASMLERCDRGARLLVENCRGVRWDCDIAHMGALRALEELGRVHELRRRLPGLIEEAISFDDLYAEVTFRLYDAFWKISRGEIDEARNEAQDVLERWGLEGFQLQHLYELRIQACCDVYAGAPHEAWARVHAAWPMLRRSGLLADRTLRSDALLLRARVALAAADAVGIKAEQEVGRAARDLERMQRNASVAAAYLLRAALAARGRDRTRSLDLLARAEAAYAGASMTLHVAYAARRRGELLGGGEGDALIWTADRALEAAGIRSPARWLEIQAPGFGAISA